MRDFFIRLNWTYRPLAFISFYAFWILIFRLLALSCIAYFTLSPTSHFQDITDAWSASEVSVIGLSALLFVSLLCGLYPLTSTSLSEVITRKSIERGFLPGFIQGAFFAGGIVLAFLLSGVYRYLGYFIQLNEAPLEIINIILRMTALVTLVFCEEFIFRYKLRKFLSQHLPEKIAVHIVAGCYCLVKILQFDLGIMHFFTLYLVSLSLFYRSPDSSQFAKSAGFWAAILIIFQPILSLPIFGNDFSGILLVKYQPIAKIEDPTDPSHSVIRFLTGGLGGPISSFTFQLLLILDICRSIFRQKKQERLALCLHTSTQLASSNLLPNQDGLLS